MERNEVLEQVNEIFIEVLDNNNVSLSDATTAADIEEWDSLTHIQIVVAIEKHFKIRFASKEILRWENVGEMINAITNKLSMV